MNVIEMKMTVILSCSKCVITRTEAMSVFADQTIFVTSQDFVMVGMHHFTSNIIWFD